MEQVWCGAFGLKRHTCLLMGIIEGRVFKFLALMNVSAVENSPNATVIRPKNAFDTARSAQNLKCPFLERFEEGTSESETLIYGSVRVFFGRCFGFLAWVETRDDVYDAASGRDRMVSETFHEAGDQDQIDHLLLRS